jgi:hypothetical protein
MSESRRVARHAADVAARAPLGVDAQGPRPLVSPFVDRNTRRTRAIKASDDRAALACVLGDTFAGDAEAPGDVDEGQPRIEVLDAGWTLVGARALAELARDVDVVFEMPADVASGLGARGVAGARGQQDEDAECRSHGHTMRPQANDRNRARVFR